MIDCTFEDGGKAKLRHVTCSTMVFDEKKEKILLIKRAPTMQTCPNLWAFPGGFFDQGEWLDEAVLRELHEETGYNGRIEALFRIIDNPVRPLEDRANVDFIHLVTALEKTGEFDKEVSEIRWFPLGEVPPKSEWAFDHYEDLELYLKYRTNPFPLPLLGRIK